MGPRNFADELRELAWPILNGKGEGDEQDRASRLLIVADAIEAIEHRLSLLEADADRS